MEPEKEKTGASLFLKLREVPDLSGDLSEKKIIEAIAIHERTIDSYQMGFNPTGSCPKEIIKQFWEDCFKYSKIIKNVREYLLLENPAPAEKIKVLQDMLDESKNFRRKYTDHVKWYFGELPKWKDY